MGGNDPGDQLTEASAIRRRELRARCNDYIKFVLVKEPPNPPAELNFAPPDRGIQTDGGDGETGARRIEGDCGVWPGK